MSRRTEMIGSTLQKELMLVIMRELNDPRIDGFPSITRVKVSTDLSTADVYVTIMGTEGKQQLALNALKHSAGMMRQKLQKTLPMRTIPFLRFQLDEALKKEIAVLDLISKAVREEDALKGQDAENPEAEGQDLDDLSAESQNVSSNNDSNPSQPASSTPAPAEPNEQ